VWNSIISAIYICKNVQPAAYQGKLFTETPWEDFPFNHFYMFQDRHGASFFFSQLDLIFVVLFVFRTELKLESLEDAVVLEAVEEDILSDKHGCPAYVSPEILK